MDLIIKPTVACNFKCTFCSSTNLSENDNDVLDISYIARFLDRYPQTRTIIVNGGDPLMLRPEYYWDILKLLEKRNMRETVLSFTSNLWAFYKKPEMWQDLFRHPQVGVATSFQYGDARLKGDLKPYTEEEFWKVSDLFLERVGYRPGFIAVITPENEDTVIKTVELAKKMGVVVKINYAMSSGPVKEFKGIRIGNAGKVYVLADIYERYLQIHEAGLSEWEHNTQQMVMRLKQEPTVCPLASDCDAGIRALQPGGDYYSCGSFGDDGLYPIDFDEEMQGPQQRPLQRYELLSMKHSCFTCPMFSICNGCKKTIHDLKSLDLVENHCEKMKRLAPRIIQAAGLTGVLEPTPYVNEKA